VVDNVFVEGDNLEVLRQLPDHCCDLIYIDPPYNTGSGFSYVDDFRAPKTPGIARNDTRHKTWRNMMYPRMLEAHRVLARSGVIYVSIDDNEVAHLRLLLDEIFGETNFLSQIVVNLNPKGRRLGGGFATSHEYVLVYARNARDSVIQPSITELVDQADFPHTASDGRKFRFLPLRNTNKKFNPSTARTLYYPIYGNPENGQVSCHPFPDSVEVWPVFGDQKPAVWRWSAPLVQQRLDDLLARRVRGRTGERVDIAQLDWWHPNRRKKLSTIWLAEEVGSIDTAVAEIRGLIGHVFETPKPLGLLRRILLTMPADARVLDFFAGSGTTGHAVALLNAEDGGKRRCLSINSAEPTRAGSNAANSGLATVADITRTRLEAVDREVGGGLVLGEVSAWTLPDSLT
jgi:adenine-specific DNA-methyltransferase